MRPGVAGLVLAAAATASGGDFDAEAARYRAYRERPSLDIRTRGRERFARSGDGRAFAELAAEYDRVSRPKDHERYLLASICGEAFRGADSLPRWRSWRASRREPRDAWLWREALEAETFAGDPGAAVEAAERAGSPFLRAAALSALADAGAPEAIPLVHRLLVGLPPDGGPEDGLLVEACAACLCGPLAAQRGSEAFDAALRALVARLDGATPARSKLVVARHLARALASKVVALESGYWRGLLAFEADQAMPRDGRYAKARFPTYFGLEGTGTRFAYVLDLSDTMLRPLTDDERGKLRGPVTGRASEAPKPEDQLPWDRIRTRFDAAREYTKHSLRLLPPSARFTVIVFGTKARPLDGAGRLVPATRASVAAACRALDDIRPGPPGYDCPDGSLLGYTNLHGGLRLAFKATDKGVLGDFEYVEPAGRARGADTIFLLSDGAPTWDDFGPTLDRREPEDQVGHPESGVPYAASESVEYCGPYWEPRHLVRDLRRLNLFRGVEIHCVGLGEASEPLLRAIAAVGLGQAIVLGKG